MSHYVVPNLMLIISRAYSELTITINIGMDGEELREDDVDREGSDGEGEGGDEDGNQAKQEYVKKVFAAKPYVSEFGDYAESEVKSLIIKNQR